MKRNDDDKDNNENKKARTKMKGREKRRGSSQKMPVPRSITICASYGEENAATT